MKKLFAVLLAVAMLLSLGVTAFAKDETAANTKIVVADPPEGVSYTAYRIFRADTEKNAANEDKIVYSIKADDPWFALLFDKNGDEVTPKDEAINFLLTKDETKGYIVEAEAGYSPADFAAWIMKNITSWPTTDAYLSKTNETTGVCEITKSETAGLPEGYYIIVPVTNADTAGSDKFSYQGSSDAQISQATYAAAIAGSDKMAATFAVPATNNCYYKITGQDLDTNENIIDYTVIIPTEFYDSLTTEQKADYTEGKCYTKLAKISESAYKELPVAEKANYKPDAPTFKRTADIETLSYAAFTATHDVAVDANNDGIDDVDPNTGDPITTPVPDLSDAKKALYEEIDVYYASGDTAKAVFYTQAQYDAMSDAQKLGYVAGKAYQTKAVISAAVFKALANDVDNALQNDYIGVKADAGVPVQDATAALTTVLDGKITQVQNKNDMPLDKQVDADADGAYDDNETGVKVGDVLNYKITSKTPASYETNKYDYIFRVSDKMSNGLTFNKTEGITVKIVKEGKDTIEITLKEGADGKLVQTVKKGDTPVAAADINATIGEAFRLVKTDATLGGNEIRFGGEDKVYGGNFTFELSMAVASEALREYAGADVEITYKATVNDEAVAELLENDAILEYGDSSDVTVKDAETDNYISQIVVDKFETGNRSQKLPGAQFRLYKQANADAEKQYYVLIPAAAAQAAVPAVPDVLWENTDDDWNEYSATNPEATQEYFTAEVVGTVKTAGTPAQAAVPASDAKVEWKTLAELTAAGKTPTVMTTDENGAASFPYLEDGTYYLEEVKAPVDYTRLLGPIEIVVDGSDSTDHRLSYTQRIDALTNVVTVANTPGSSMPSTGGVGATLMTIGGVALILAAGAFLVLRRRKEQE